MIHGGAVSVRRLLFGCALLLAAPTSAYGWEIELHGMATMPDAVREGEPFDVVFDLAYNGCQPTIESVEVLRSLVLIEGSVGPPPDGGCGGVVVEHYLLPVRVAGLAAGEYRVDALFRRMRDGEISDELQGAVWVRGAMEIPTVSGIGTSLFVFALAFLGARRVAS